MMALSNYERVKRHRERQRMHDNGDNETMITAANDNENPQADDNGVCTHERIVPTEGARPLTYTAKGPPISWAVASVLPLQVECPCCGVEWLCKRPDVQNAYCASCDEAPADAWGERFPYKRPEMKPRSALGL